MQTREPRKRVNWVFVIILIIAVPLIIFLIIMFNTVDEQANEKMHEGPKQELKNESPANQN